MKLIVGLGNPGQKYQNTKHNAGFMAIDLLVEKILGKNVKWNESKKSKYFYLKTEINNENIEIIKPQTYMNNSGQVINYIFKKHNLKPENIFIVYDDIDIGLGNLKIGYFDSAGGHNGIKSIIQHLGLKNFLRFRIGIKAPLLEKMPADKYVLSRFSFLEKIKIKKILNKTAEAIISSLEKSPIEAMNRYN